MKEKYSVRARAFEAMSGEVKVARLPAVDSNVPDSYVPDSYVNDDGKANLDRTNVRNQNPVRLAVVILR